MARAVQPLERDASAASAPVPGSFDYFLDEVGLPPEEIAWFRSAGRQRRLLKRDIFCGIGQDTHELGVLRRGILVVYLVTADGERVVLDFVFPGQLALALEAAARNAPSEVCFEAIATSELTVWPYDLRHVAATRHPAWRALETRLTEVAYARNRGRLVSLRTLSARKHYDQLRRELPPEWRRIPQHFLAAYLNITPQHLSRLKHGKDG